MDRSAKWYFLMGLFLTVCDIANMSIRQNANFSHKEKAKILVIGYGRYQIVLNMVTNGMTTSERWINPRRLTPRGDWEMAWTSEFGLILR
jgi:hypothetical protein